MAPPPNGLAAAGAAKMAAVAINAAPAVTALRIDGDQTALLGNLIGSTFRVSGNGGESRATTLVHVRYIRNDRCSLTPWGYCAIG